MPAFETMRALLTQGGHRLSVGRAGVANRASDALDAVSRSLPSLLDSWKAALLGLLTEATQNKLRWHLASIVPRLKLSVPERRRVAEALQSYLDDPSSIVKTCALQGLADLVRQDAALLPEVLDPLRIHSRSGTRRCGQEGAIYRFHWKGAGKAEAKGITLLCSMRCAMQNTRRPARSALF